jgi:hypothetical protein
MATLFEGIGITGSLVTLFLSILRLGCLHNQSDFEASVPDFGKTRGELAPRPAALCVQKFGRTRLCDVLNLLLKI